MAGIARPQSRAEKLIQQLHAAFDYTGDNNRDLIADASFPIESAWEEIEIAAAYQKLVAYIHRNEDMINSNLEDA